MINQSAEIGENCTLHPCTLVGGMRGKGVPRGNKVFIGNGVKIIGNVDIGDWCFICPNTVVVKDQEPGTTISGIPSRVLNYYGNKKCKLFI